MLRKITQPMTRMLLGGRRKLAFLLVLATLSLLTTVQGIPAIAAHPSSPTATAIVPPSAITAANPQSFMDGGRTAYGAGQLTQALTQWQQAVQAYATQGNLVDQALALSYVSLVQQDLGDWDAARAAIVRSLAVLEQLPEQAQKQQAVLAQILNTQASLQLSQGQSEKALATWKQAEAAYRQVGDAQGALGAQLNQAEALQTLGLFRRAQDQLEAIQNALQQQPSPALRATGLRNLGRLFQAVGNLPQARLVLEQSLNLVQALNQPLDLSLTFSSLGNIYQALGESALALNAYERAAAIAPNSAPQIEAQLNQLSLLTQLQRWSEAQTLFQRIQPQLAQPSASRPSIYASVNLVERWLQLSQKAPAAAALQLASEREMANMLAIALQQSRQIQDLRAESFVLGQLGKLYERTGQPQEARGLTEQALILAQSINADDLAYRWQWQLGRLLKQQGNETEAIAAYSGAVKSLKVLRSDLIAVSSDVQFSFREQVEPVYRELVSLLLKAPNPSQEKLIQARAVIESLQLAELENFFRSACLDATPRQIDQIDPKAAVIYPIILPDRLAVVLAIPGQPIRYYSTPLPQTEVDQTLERLLQSLNPAFSNRERLRLSEKVYSWLVRPAVEQLTQNGIKTLVFVPDGLLKNLPMAALYDGKQYLIEQYRVALTPGLQLLAAQGLTQNRLQVLMGGLSEARQGFSALPGVEAEVQRIATQVSVDQLLLNQAFTKSNLQQRINSNPLPIIHLATHGQFSSNLNETFILTWDDKVNIQDFYSLLQNRTANDRQPLELLILSACQTASGDDKAALGLAGLAVRSGARSTIASLWAVNDQSTAQLMTEFYQNLANQAIETRAEALQKAQVKLLNSPQYKHPYYWAAFVLVGNWT